jgi:phosphonopyruvate decarboxylase
MIDPKGFFDALKAKGVGLFAGVPDSLLSSFCACVDDHGEVRNHIITANEGNAVALAAGHYLATGQVSVVYLQNSGLGNAVNPIASLADPQVYRIPFLMLIGWRGEPGVKDEPQHVKQGRITPGQLDLLEIPYWVLDAQSDTDDLLGKAFESMAKSGGPSALLVRKDTFAPYKSSRKAHQLGSLRREDALNTVLDLTDPDDLVVATTGKTSRELFELRARRNEAQRDFLTVGGMGHTASIATGVALGSPQRRVVCLDGDGSLLMHMGAMPVIGSLKPANLVHVLLNNAAHESVGGQATVAGSVDFRSIAIASRYGAYFVSNDDDEIRSAWAAMKDCAGPVFFEIRLAQGSRSDLGRPTSSPEENKAAFMQHARG